MMITYGSTTNFVVSYDSSFTGGAQPDGPALAQGVIDNCEYDLVRLSMLFGGLLPPASSLPFQVNLVPGSGGANNNGVNTINCFCNLGTDPLGLPALVVAEEIEIFMNIQGKGWIAGWSNGEALSRVSAQILYPNRAWLFMTGNSWLTGVASSPNPARSNWVDNVYHSDQDLVSVGCGSLFLNYLAYQLNLRWPDIIQAGAPTTNTLAETATILGVSNAWLNFFNLIQTYLPSPMTLPPEPTSLGQPPEPTDDPYPLGLVTAPAPILYMRHNLADDGTSHTGSLSDSPDIIVKNNPVANPQASYSTPASIASDTESDPDVVTGQANYVYMRVWNRGVDAANVFATVYWSPPATLVSPNLWTLIGSAYYPDVPAGSEVEVSTPGITWPADRLPGAGHYCFVATVGNADAPAPNPSSFASFTDFMNYIYANNNITWRNFNVDILPAPHHFPIHFGEFVALPFLIAGAWDGARVFSLETHAELPDESRIALQVPHWIGRGFKPDYPGTEEFDDAETDPGNRRRIRIPLPRNGRQSLGFIELPAGTAASSHMLVHIPEHRHQKPLRVVIRQLFEEREVGRITWLLRPKHRDGIGDD
jgi:hypothetical protein